MQITGGAADPPPPWVRVTQQTFCPSPDLYRISQSHQSRVSGRPLKLGRVTARGWTAVAPVAVGRALTVVDGQPTSIWGGGHKPRTSYWAQNENKTTTTATTKPSTHGHTTHHARAYATKKPPVGQPSSAFTVGLTRKKAHFKFWVKLGCSRRYTQIVPKWHLASQLAGPDFFNTRARRDAQKTLHYRRERIWVDSAC